jgi:3-methyladenine DNA glycosylase AlkD
MMTVDSVMSELKKKGSEKTRKIYARHGMVTDKMFGVSVADLKAIAKKIKGRQALACELFATGNVDAMYLAGMIADGSQMSRKQLNEWAESASPLRMIAEYTVPWVAVENAEARELAMEWIKSKKAGASGWCTYSGMLATKPDEELDLQEIEKLLGTLAADINSAQDRERSAMNAFVIAVGAYVRPLLKKAKATARQIGEVSVDVGDTSCKVPLASAYIEKIENAGRVGKKRKTIRC